MSRIRPPPPPPTLLDYLRRPAYFPPPKNGYSRAARSIIFLRTCLLYQLVVVALDVVVAWLAPSKLVPRRALLITQPRSGSTLLLATFANDPRVVCQGEILNHAFVRYGDVRGAAAWRREVHVRAAFVRFPAVMTNLWRIVRSATVLNGLFSGSRCVRPRAAVPLVELVVAKVFLYHVTAAGASGGGGRIGVKSAETVVPLERLMRILDVRSNGVICLYRRCMLSTYASLLAAFRNNVWVSGVEGEENSRRDSLVFVNADEFEAWAGEQRSAWHELLEENSLRQSYTLVAYEDLAAYPAAVASDCLREVLFTSKSIVHEPTPQYSALAGCRSSRSRMPRVQNSQIPLKHRVRLDYPAKTELLPSLVSSHQLQL